MEIEWTSVTLKCMIFCIRVMSFPQTRPEVLVYNLEYFVAFNGQTPEDKHKCNTTCTLKMTGGKHHQEVHSKRIIKNVYAAKSLSWNSGKPYGAKRASNRKPQTEFAPSDSPWERPCFNSGTILTQGLGLVTCKYGFEEKINLLHETVILVMDFALRNAPLFTTRDRVKNVYLMIRPFHYWLLASNLISSTTPSYISLTASYSVRPMRRWKKIDFTTKQIWLTSLNSKNELIDWLIDWLIQWFSE